MGDKTGISWTDATWNPLRGCSNVSAGCKNCYAETMAARFSGPGMPYEGTIRDGRWNGSIRLVPEKLSEPLRWKRPRRIFVNSMSDLFHDGVPFEYVAAVFGVMAACPQHTFQVLTKRPARAVEFFKWETALALRDDGSVDTFQDCPPGWRGPTQPRDRMIAACARRGLDVPLQRGGPWPLPNVHLGVSVEDQATADDRIPLLQQCPAAVRFVSYEPALGPVDFSRFHSRLESMGEGVRGLRVVRGLDWIIVGGESGVGARPFNLAWARKTVKDCREHRVPVFVKQLGARPVVEEGSTADGWAAAGLRIDDCGGVHLRHPKGADMAEWPEDLRVQEFPAER